MTQAEPVAEASPQESPAASPYASAAVNRLLQVVARLRDPNGGCPWDLKQTHATLRRYVIEEAYELADAIDHGTPQTVKDELGDVLLQVALHAQLASEAGQFDFDAICAHLADKLVRRHPHVFGDGEAQGLDADGVTAQWDAIKAQERAGGGGEACKSILDDVPGYLPALSRALETSKRAVTVGFDWPTVAMLWQCVMSEYDEFKAETCQPRPERDRLEDEMGDILFATVNLARQHGIDPETALNRAVGKFTRRFQAMERLAEKPLAELDFATWDALWNQAKQATAIPLREP